MERLTLLKKYESNHKHAENFLNNLDRSNSYLSNRLLKIDKNLYQMLNSEHHSEKKVSFKLNSTNDYIY